MKRNEALPPRPVFLKECEVLLNGMQEKDLRALVQVLKDALKHERMTAAGRVFLFDLTGAVLEAADWESSIRM